SPTAGDGTTAFATVSGASAGGRPRVPRQPASTRRTTAAAVPSTSARRSQYRVAAVSRADRGGDGDAAGRLRPHTRQRRRSPGGGGVRHAGPGTETDMTGVLNGAPGKGSGATGARQGPGGGEPPVE